MFFFFPFRKVTLDTLENAWGGEGGSPTGAREEDKNPFELHVGCGGFFLRAPRVGRLRQVGRGGAMPKALQSELRVLALFLSCPTLAHTHTHTRSLSLSLSRVSLIHLSSDSSLALSPSIDRSIARSRALYMRARAGLDSPRGHGSLKLVASPAPSDQSVWFSVLPIVDSDQPHT